MSESNEIEIDKIILMNDYLQSNLENNKEKIFYFIVEIEPLMEKDYKGNGDCGLLCIYNFLIRNKIYDKNKNIEDFYKETSKITNLERFEWLDISDIYYISKDFKINLIIFEDKEISLFYKITDTLKIQNTLMILRKNKNHFVELISEKNKYGWSIPKGFFNYNLDFLNFVDKNEILLKKFLRFRGNYYNKKFKNINEYNEFYNRIKNKKLNDTLIIDSKIEKEKRPHEKTKTLEEIIKEEELENKKFFDQENKKNLETHKINLLKEKERERKEKEEKEEEKENKILENKTDDNEDLEVINVYKELKNENDIVKIILSNNEEKWENSRFENNEIKYTSAVLDEGEIEEIGNFNEAKKILNKNYTVFDFLRKNLKEKFKMDFSCCNYLELEIISEGSEFNNDLYKKELMKTIHYIEDNYYFFLNPLKTKCSINCLENLIGKINYLIEISKKSKINKSSKCIILGLVSLYYHFRHDILFSQIYDILMNCFKKDQYDPVKNPFIGTDIPFKQFGINSNKTPDFICEVENKKGLIIIEHTVTSDFDKASFLKGNSEIGMKYDKEYLMCKEKYDFVLYKNFITDLTDEKSSEISKNLKELIPGFSEKNLLFYKQIKNNFRKIKSLGYWSTILFGEKYMISQNCILGANKLIDNIKKSYKFKNRFDKDKFEITKYDKRLMARLKQTSKSFLRSSHFLDQSKKYQLTYFTQTNEFKLMINENGKTPLYWQNLGSNDQFMKMYQLTEVINADNTRSKFSFSDSSDIKIHVNNFNEGKSENKIGQGFFTNDEDERNFSVIKDKDSIKYTDSEDFKNSVGIKRSEESSFISKYENKINDLNDELKIDFGENYTYDFFEDLKNGFQSVKDSKIFENKEFLSFNNPNKEDLKDNLNEAYEKYKSLNEESGESKQPFIYPIVDLNYSQLINYNTVSEFPKKVFPLINLKDKVVKECFTKLCSGNYNKKKTFVENSVEKDIRKHFVNTKNDYYETVINIKNKYNLSKIPRKKEIENLMKECDDIDLKNQYVERSLLFKNRENEYLKNLKESKKQGFEATLILTHPEKPDLSHFENRTKGIGRPDLRVETMDELIEFLLSPSKFLDENFNLKMQDEFDTKNMLILKREMMKTHAKFNSYLSKTNLANSSKFINRLCYTLSYLSQSNFNHKYCAYENLGYDNVILLVRGGKKIFKTRQSKLFKLFYPAPEIIKNLYPNSNLIMIEGKPYMETKWSYMNERVLNEGISFYFKISGYLINTSIRQYNVLEKDKERFNNDFKPIMKKFMIPIILAFHNRRKTEVMMHNMRYLIVNCLGVKSHISELFNLMIDRNTDFVQFFLREMFFKEYLNLAESLLKIRGEKTNNLNDLIMKGEIKNIFINQKIETPDELCSMIYSTYLMVKAPINQRMEQSKNLISMLEIEKDFKKVYDKCFEFSSQEEKMNSNEKEEKFENFITDLYSDDFKYNSKFMYMLGEFTSEFLEKNSGFDFYNSFGKISNKSWSKIANSAGLRGEGKGFFGNKGYYIVFEEILKDEREKLKELKEIYNSTESLFIKNQKLLKLNESVNKKLFDTEINELNFHVVDKIQRAGGREIYVMDWKTKLGQSLIEDYFGDMCKSIPNEFISIPSNRRLQQIHHNMFEKEDKKYNHSLYLTLDCRKWAPKSNLNKMVMFVLGMSKRLPIEFTNHFLSFFEKMYKKRIHTRKEILEIITGKGENKQKRYSFNIEEIFKSDESRKSEYFEMNYSWVIGIFNYLSSIIHAATQLISKNFLRNYFSEDRKVNLEMKAHSDDSGGVLKLMNLDDLNESLNIYQTFLKMGNMLISTKKSVISPNYFELLSILYLNKTLLPLVSKFLSGTIFNPTDKGYFSDLNTVYSHIVSLISNGATYSEAYFNQRLLDTCIKSFYKVKFDKFGLIPQLGGNLTSFPGMIIIGGSNTDVIRLMNFSKEKTLRQLLLLRELTSKENDEMFTKLIKASPKVYIQNKFNKFLNLTSKDEFNEAWTISNVQLNNTVSQLVQFGKKLSNKSFYTALQDESPTRRMSRAFFFISTECYDTYYGVLKLKTIIDLSIKMIMDYEKKEIFEDFKFLKKEFENFFIKNHEQEIREINNKFNFLFSEAMSMITEFESNNLDELNLQKQNLTCKPTYLNFQLNNINLNIKTNASVLTSWIKEPKFRFMVSNKDLTREIDYIKENLKTYNIEIENCNSNELFNILSKISSKSEKVLYFYSYAESERRTLLNNREIFLNWSTNTIFMRKIINFERFSTVSSRNKILTRINSIPFEVNEWIKVFLLYYYLKRSNQAGLEYLEWKTPSGVMQFDKIRETEIEDVNRDFLVNIMNLEKELNDTKNNFELNKLNWWFYWINEQKKIGSEWTGYGRVFIKMPLLRVIFTFQGNKIISCIHDSENEIDFDYTHSWFLTQIFKTLGKSFSFFRPRTEEFNLSFGVDKLTDNWALKNSNSLKFTCLENKKEDISFYDISNDNIIFEKELRFRVLLFRNESKKRSNKVYFIDSEIKFGIDDLNEILPMNENNKLRISVMKENPTSLLKTIMLKDKILNMKTSPKDLSEKFLESAIYVRATRHMLKNKNLKSALMEEKNYDLNFKFEDPNLTSTEMIMNGLLSYENLPYSISKKLNEDIFKILNKSHKIELEKDIIDSIILHKKDISYLISRWGDDTIKAGITSMLEKNDIFFDISTCISFNDDYINLFYDNFKVLICSIYNTIDTDDFQIWFQEDDFPYQNRNDSLIFFQKIIYQLCLNSRIQQSSFCHNYSEAFYFIKMIIDYILNDNECSTIFEIEIQKGSILRKLPVSKEFSEKWFYIFINFYRSMCFKFNSILEPQPLELQEKRNVRNNSSFVNFNQRFDDIFTAIGTRGISSTSIYNGVFKSGKKFKNEKSLIGSIKDGFCISQGNVEKDEFTMLFFENSKMDYEKIGSRFLNKGEMSEVCITSGEDEFEIFMEYKSVRNYQDYKVENLGAEHIYYKYNNLYEIRKVNDRKFKKTKTIYCKLIIDLCTQNKSSLADYMISNNSNTLFIMDSIPIDFKDLKCEKRIFKTKDPNLFHNVSHECIFFIMLSFEKMDLSQLSKYFNLIELNDSQINFRLNNETINISNKIVLKTIDYDLRKEYSKFMSIFMRESNRNILKTVMNQEIAADIKEEENLTKKEKNIKEIFESQKLKSKNEKKKSMLKIKIIKSKKEKIMKLKSEEKIETNFIKDENSKLMAEEWLLRNKKLVKEIMKEKIPEKNIENIKNSTLDEKIDFLRKIRKEINDFFSLIYHGGSKIDNFFRFKLSFIFLNCLLEYIDKENHIKIFEIKNNIDFSKREEREKTNKKRLKIDEQLISYVKNFFSIKTKNSIEEMVNNLCIRTNKIALITNKNEKYKEVKKQLKTFGHQIPLILKELTKENKLMDYTYLSDSPDLQSEFDCISKNLLPDILTGLVRITEKEKFRYKQMLLLTKKILKGTYRNNELSPDFQNKASILLFFETLLNDFIIIEDSEFYSRTHLENIRNFIQDYATPILTENDDDEIDFNKIIITNNSGKISDFHYF